MKYEAKLIDGNGNTLFALDGETVDTGDLSNVPEDFRFPKSYKIKNIEENEDLYHQLLKYVAKTLRLESDQINGLFEIGLDNGDITLREMLK
jgi:hypothetical protein